jgi:PAS domain-containing protein
VISNNNQLTRAFEEHVRRNLHHVDESLQTVKFDFEREQRVTPFIRRYYARLADDPLLNQSILLDQDRKVLASALPVKPDTKFVDLPHFEYHRTIDRWELFIGKQFVGRVSGKASIHLSRRLNNADGGFAGVVIAAIDPLFFTRFYQDMELPPDTVVRVVGLDGWVRASRDPDEPKTSPNLRTVGVLFKYHEQNRIGHYTSIGAVSGKIRFFSYRSLSDYPLIVQVGIDSQVALAPYYIRRNLTYGLASFISILLLGFTGGVATLSKRRHQSEQRHQLLFSSMSAGAIYYDSECRLLDCNEAAAHILGISLQQCRNRSLLDPEWQSVQEDGKTMSADSFPAVLALRTGKTVEQHILGVYNPQVQGIVWLNATAVPQFRTGDIKPHQVFLLFSDITERVRQERSLIHDARLANRIQHALLPQPAKSEHFDLRTIYQPYRYISGDLYFMDWRQENQVLRCYLIDVTGHGLATALHTSAINVLLHEVNDLDLSLAEQLHWLNRQTTRYFEDAAFAAAIIFEIDLTLHQLRYACAGIPEFWLSNKQHSGPIQAKGLFLGIDATETFESHTIALTPGDCLYFMTDGLTDVLRQRSEPPLADFDTMLAYLNALPESEECRDDATAICIKIKSLPREQDQLNGWPRYLNINGYGDYRRRRETLTNWLSELTGRAHSVQEVAINEALANALECRDNIPRPHQARIKLNRIGRVFVVRIKTNRIGFAGNALLRRLKASPESLFSYGQLESMGRGIPLMVSLSDRITYNSEGTELLMAWKLD